MSALYALAAFAMTLAGGAFAFRYQRYLLYIMAFSSGLLIGVAFLDLIPEVSALAVQHGIEIPAFMLTVIGGVLTTFLQAQQQHIQREKKKYSPSNNKHDEAH